MHTLLAKLQSLPPYKVRLHARHKHKRVPMTNDEIAERSGLSPETVRRLSHLESWNTVAVETLLRFCAACGVEMLRQKRARQFERETNGFKSAAHLRHPSTQPHFFEAIRDGRKGLSWADYRQGGRQNEPRKPA